MIQPKYNPKESLNRIKLMMDYDTSKTLNENVKTNKLLNEGIYDKVKEMLDACSTGLGAEMQTRYMKQSDIDDCAGKFVQSFGSAFGTKLDPMREALKIMTAKGGYQDLCMIAKSYEDQAGESFLEGIDADIDYDSEWAEFSKAFQAMKNRSQAQGLKTKEAQQANIDWWETNFPCIFQSNGNVDEKPLPDQNKYYYIRIKGTSNNEYQVFGDGRVKKSDGTATGKKVSCSGSKVTFVNESIEKKNVFEQIDDSGLIDGGSSPTPTPNPNPTPTPKPKPNPRPSELATVDGVKAFQDWLDENHPNWATGYKDGILNKGKNGGGYGTFGPRTSKAWASYKDDYLSGKTKPTPEQDKEVQDVDFVDY
jgi:hypothetical protein